MWDAASIQALAPLKRKHAFFFLSCLVAVIAKLILAMHPRPHISREDMRTMGFWAEGVAGKVHLEIKSAAWPGQFGHCDWRLFWVT